MVEIRKGITQKKASTDKLIAYFKSQEELDGYLYIGYPMLYSGGDSTAIDALWISREQGIIIFDVVEGVLTDREEIQDDLFAKISSQLFQYKELLNNRSLAVSVEVVTYAPYATEAITADKVFKSDAELGAFIESYSNWDHPNLYEKVVSVVQSVTKLKVAKKRDNVKKKDSRGAKLKNLEDTISNLDSEQEEAVIEYYSGVQRIRGLAGSGKTIVLALKAAYLYSQNPDWKIAVTFQTRSLKDQFKTLIERFCIEKRGEMPDWNNLKIIHAWGSSNSEGIYYNFCKNHGIEYHDYRSAKRIKEADEPPFEPVCEKALHEVKFPKQSYDAILIDEAQDLPEAFLKLCYNILKDPKRLVYAYDELQRLNEGSSLDHPSNLFDIDEDNFKDTILYKCYRNSRPILVTAHALGFGIYRKEENDNDVKSNLVQFFDEPQLWDDVGYEAKEGSLTANSSVKLKRSEDASPSYLEKYLDNDVDDIVKFKSFRNSKEQSSWVSEQIEINLKDEELLSRDIIVINANSMTTKSDTSSIRQNLYKNDIRSHIAGDLNADVFYKDNSVAFTSIYRAKGNEVPMVYLINAQNCYTGKELIKKRNTLFTAITRSKAWVRVCGVGESMEKLIEEYEQVKDKNFELHFTYPTEEEIAKMNVINRDMSFQEKKAIKNDIEAIRALVKNVKSGKTHLEDYPEEIQKVIKAISSL